MIYVTLPLACVCFILMGGTKINIILFGLKLSAGLFSVSFTNTVTLTPRIVGVYEEPQQPIILTLMPTISVHLCYTQWALRRHKESSRSPSYFHLQMHFVPKRITLSLTNSLHSPSTTLRVRVTPRLDALLIRCWPPEKPLTTSLADPHIFGVVRQEDRHVAYIFI